MRQSRDDPDPSEPAVRRAAATPAAGPPGPDCDDLASTRLEIEYFIG
jgi:hypothetical protein